jgi:hypothetical protein
MWDILVKKSEDERRSVKRIYEAQDSEQWQDVVNTVTNLRIPQTTTAVLISRIMLASILEQGCQQSLQSDMC